MTGTHKSRGYPLTSCAIWCIILDAVQQLCIESIRVRRFVAGPAQTLQQEVTEHEGSSVREAHLREVQDHPPQGQGHGDLRESQAQAEAGLIQSLPLAGPIKRHAARPDPSACNESGFGHFFVFSGEFAEVQLRPIERR